MAFWIGWSKKVSRAGELQRFIWLWRENCEPQRIGAQEVMRSVACLSDRIEEHLLELLRSEERVEVQRCALAERFGCAPSEITYVLMTRFRPEQGFVVQSRRGGGGFVRLWRQPAGQTQIPAALSEHAAEGLLELWQLSARERAMLRAVVDRRTLAVPLPLRDELRARILRAALAVVS